MPIEGECNLQRLEQIDREKSVLQRSVNVSAAGKGQCPRLIAVPGEAIKGHHERLISVHGDVGALRRTIRCRKKEGHQHDGAYDHIPIYVTGKTQSWILKDPSVV